MSDYSKLQELAEAATAGPWRLVREGIKRIESESAFVCEAGGLVDLDADFIAAANPAAVLALIAERDQLFGQTEQLKAENEALRLALREVMAQVDGNIRETVRDCVNGHNDVQDIYGYCDVIEGIVGGALLTE